MDDPKYRSRDFRLWKEPAYVTGFLERHGKRISDDIYHIKDLTVRLGGESDPSKSYLSITWLEGREEEMNDLFRKLDVRVAPLIMPEEFTAQMEGKAVRL
ncbi:MAG: hypothetical protein HY518_00115 [Candidatus Aenigmarchaeota archaeon]|nr:hypothetical protein [Candidatus Aenigmarchaeota archaeon]